MAPPHVDNSLQKEGRIYLAIHSLYKNQIPSHQRAAPTYNVSETILRDRQKGIPPKRETRAKNRKLLKAEEQELIQ
jgi:hypothetical protein